MAETKQPINVAIEPEEPKDMDLTITQVQNIAEYGRRSHDKWLMNERSGSSLMFRNNGQANMAASKYSQYKLNPEGSSQENTLISQTITNRKILQADEFVFNNHKFNTQLIDLADFRKMKVDQNQNCVVGNFTVFGSVLVKAWEENLKRYMLIRRPARMSLFSPLLNVPDIMPASQVRSPLKSDEKLVGISDKGYQVNMIIYDHNTLIGKEGVDREGIDRSAEHSGGIIGYSGGGGAAGGGGRAVPLGSLGTSADAAVLFKALRKLGYNDEAAAGIMGNMQQESGCDPTSGRDNPSAVACGICQWGHGADGGRWDTFVAKVGDPQCWDLGAQLENIVNEGYGPELYNGCTTPEEAAQKFEETFERAGIPMMENRMSYARQFYDQLKGSYEKDPANQPNKKGGSGPSSEKK